MRWVPLADVDQELTQAEQDALEGARWFGMGVGGIALMQARNDKEEIVGIQVTVTTVGGKLVGMIVRDNRELVWVVPDETE